MAATGPDLGLLAQAPLVISAAFDSGNIEVVDASDPADVRLRIRPDPWCQADQAHHFQWFHFQVTTQPGQALVLHIVNAGEASYPSAWDGYKACASYDLEAWWRIPDTSYDEAAGVLTIRFTPQQRVTRLAYWAPFSWERHCSLVARMQLREHVRAHVLTRTHDGRDLHMLQVGSPAPDKATLWVICRQHPGESMAEYFAEGLLERLTGPGPDAERDALLGSAVLYVVPNCCPDGSVRGHLRTNAVGSNLNREWARPSAEASPEVLAISAAIRDGGGLDAFLDVHGDEEIPANFVGSMFGVPQWHIDDGRLARLEDAFKAALLEESPDFQTELGYPLPPVGGANLATASKAHAAKYNTLSLVLEMPFKDCIGTPNAETGWSPQRARAFGGAHVAVFRRLVPTLLAERAGR